MLVFRFRANDAPSPYKVLCLLHYTGLALCFLSMRSEHLQRCIRPPAGTRKSEQVDLRTLQQHNNAPDQELKEPGLLLVIFYISFP